jgi:hypothetical protein
MTLTSYRNSISISRTGAFTSATDTQLGSPTPERLLSRYDADVIIYGHTHRALIRRAGQRLVVNPGAAGPRRFDLKPSVGLLRIFADAVDVEIVEL